MRWIRNGKKVADWENLKSQNGKSWINIAMFKTVLTGKKVPLGLRGINRVK